MYKTVQTCEHCGANLTLDDMRKTNCRYCGTVFPHHSMAAQHAQVAGQMMGNIMAQQAQVQNQWRAAYGVPPMPPAQPMMPGQPGAPMVNPNQMAQAHMAQAHQMSSRIMLFVLISVIGSFMLAGAIVLLMLIL